MTTHFRSPAAVTAAVLLLASFVSGQSPWTQLFPSGAAPSTRHYGASAVLDSASDRTIVFGGDNGSAPTGELFVLTGATAGGASAWQPLAAAGISFARANHSAAYDPSTNRMIVFGGCAGRCLPSTNTVFVVTNANGLGGTPTRIQLLPSGPAPAPRHSAAAVYDQGTNRLIVFGGHDGSGLINASSTFADTWILTNANGLGGTPQWIQVSTSGPPPIGRYGPTGAFDHIGNRLIVTGGITASANQSNGVWVLNNVLTGAGDWINTIPDGAAGNPPPFANIRAGHDAGGARLLLPISNPVTGTHDVWSLQNATSWTRSSPPFGPAATLQSMGTVYNAVTDTLAGYFSGALGGPIVNQVWSFHQIPNQEPVFEAPTPFAPIDVQAGSNVAFVVQARDPDSADTVNVEVDFATLPPGALTNGTPGNPGTRSVSWTPGGQHAGPYQIRFLAHDNSGATVEHVVTINVTPNTPPSFIPPTPFAPITATAGVPLVIDLAASDVDAAQTVHINVNFGTLPPGMMVGQGTPGNPAQLSISWTPNLNNVGPHTIQVSARDDLFAATEHSITINVEPPPNRPPTVQIVGGPAFTRNEGTQTLFLNSQAFDPDFDPLTYQWSIASGPGFFNGPANNFGVAYGHNDGPATATVQVTVTDPHGASATATATITTTNVAPTVSIFGGNPLSIFEGFTLNQGGSFQDPGADQATATVDYGDGTGVQPLGFTNNVFQLSHLYPTRGTYTITVAVTDDDGGVGSASKNVTVNNVPPTIQVGAGSDTVLAGQPFTRNGSFTDPGVNPWTGTVDYGDGSGPQPLPLTGKTFALNHVYAAGGTYQVSLAISDGVATAFSNISVSVISVPPFTQVPNTPPGECVCTPSARLVVPNSPHNWFVMANSSGSLTVTLINSVDTAGAHTVLARVSTLEGAVLADMMSSYPAGTEEETAFRVSRTIAAEPGTIYRVQVMSPTAATQFAARYWLRFDGAVTAGTGTPTFNNIYGGMATWLVNVDAADPVALRLFTQGANEFDDVMPRLLAYQWVAPDGTVQPMQAVNVTVPLPPQFLDTTIAPPSGLTPGIWRLRTHTNFDYRLEKQSGVDRGLYLDHRSAGRGSFRINLVDQNGQPFTDPVTMTISFGDSVTLEVEGGVFDRPQADAFIYHVEIQPPAGRIVSPASFDIVVVCDELTEVTVVIAPPEPPAIAVTLSPDELWPANNRMVGVEAAIEATSPYGNPIAVELVGIVASDGEAGDIAGAEFGTDDRAFELRAKRNGNEPRTYTATYRVTDLGTGLSTTASATATVPPNRRPNRPNQ